MTNNDRSRPPLWGYPAHRRQDHAPAGKSRRVLNQFLGGEVGNGSKKNWFGCLDFPRTCGTLERAGNPQLGRGAISPLGGGWGIKQRSTWICTLSFSWGYLIRVNRKKGGGYRVRFTTPAWARRLSVPKACIAALVLLLTS